MTELSDKWVGVDIKLCIVCERYKTMDNFRIGSRSPGGKRYPSSTCNSCDSQKRSAQYKEKRKNEDYRRKGIAKSKGITLEEYNRQILAQANACAICHRAIALEVDHDHACCDHSPTCGNCNRGFLCVRCNRTLGSVGDDIGLLGAMISYLKNQGIWSERFTEN